MAITVHIESRNGLTLIRPDVESLDLSTARGFRREVMERVAHDAKAILDLSRVEFIDSTGCGAILGCLRHFHEETGHRGNLKLCASKPAVRALFEMVRLHKVVEIYNTTDEAIQSYQVA